MKKIILIPANADANRGDQALVWESVRFIKEVYKDCVDISLISDKDSVDNGSVRQTKKELNLKYIDPILKHPGRFFKKDMEKNVEYGIQGYIKLGFVAFIDLIASLLLLIRCKWVNDLGLLLFPKDAKISFEKFKEADAIFVKGGGFIHSHGGISDPYRMYFLLYLILLSQRFNKNVYILPNSIGPLKNKIARLLVNSVLRKCKLVTVRESISYDFLNEELKLRCVQACDFGFFLSDDFAFNTTEYLKGKIKSDKKVVGITMRPDRNLLINDNGRKYKDYIQSFVDLVIYLNKRNYYVCFFAHTLGPSANENDEIAIKDVIKSLPTEADFAYISDPDLNCKQVMKLYSFCEYFIGTRFHSVIFAQNMQIPTIAITYGGNKGEGIMKDMKLSDYVIKMSDIHGECLIDKFKLIEKEKEHYKHLLKDWDEFTKREWENLVSIIRRNENVF